MCFLRTLLNQKEGENEERGRYGIGETQEQDKGTPQHDGEGKSQDDSQAASSSALEKETERFRELLLYGRKKVSRPQTRRVHGRALVCTVLFSGASAP